MPEMGLYGPDGKVLASAPWPTSAPEDYVLFDEALARTDGSFDMLVVTHQSIDYFVSQHSPTLEQTHMVDTKLPDSDSSLLHDGSSSFVLWENGAFKLAEVKAGALVSTKTVALTPDLSLKSLGRPALVASDGQLLFSGVTVGPSSKLAILRVNPTDGSGTALTLSLQGNEVRPVGMVRSGSQIIVVAAEGDEKEQVVYLTAMALNDLGTQVVRQPVRVEENSFQGPLRDLQLDGTRVVGIQGVCGDASGVHLESFDVNTFKPYPDLCLKLPDGYFGGPFSYGLALYDGSLYAGMSIQNGVSAYAILERLPPLDPP